jgi:quercetin dioxygenase-like cupin family protein
MQRNIPFSILVSVLWLSGCAQSPVGDFAFPEGEVQHVVRVEDIQWGPCPPPLPPGGEIAVLEGNPNSGELFTVRFRLEEGFVMPPHTHPKDERVTVLEGRVSVAFGMDGSRENAEQFGPGDHYVNRRGAVHTVWADEASVVQVTGMGPWEANFVEDARSGAAR